MPLILNGANSPTKLQSKPERYLFLDEVRDWPEPAVVEKILKHCGIWKEESDRGLRPISDLKFQI